MTFSPIPPSAPGSAETPTHRQHAAAASVPSGGGGLPPAAGDDFVQDPAARWRMEVGAETAAAPRQPWRLSDVAPHRAAEALRFAAELEEHLLRCSVCGHTAHCEDCGRQLCAVGRPLLTMARAARELALAHVQGRV
jgi:hypothetical protein